MNEYLSIIITNGTNEWQRQGIAVPRKGDDIIVRKSGSGEIEFEGEVESVCWTMTSQRAGMVVTVWIK